MDQRVGARARTGHGRANRKWAAFKCAFKAAGETRTYAVDQAPLKRVRFRVGDKIKTQADQEFIVQEVVEQQALLIYVAEQPAAARSAGERPRQFARTAGAFVRRPV